MSKQAALNRELVQIGELELSPEAQQRLIEIQEYADSHLIIISIMNDWIVEKLYSTNDLIGIELLLTLIHFRRLVESLKK